MTVVAGMQLIVRPNDSEAEQFVVAVQGATVGDLKRAIRSARGYEIYQELNLTVRSTGTSLGDDSDSLAEQDLAELEVLNLTLEDAGLEEIDTSLGDANQESKAVDAISPPTATPVGSATSAEADEGSDLGDLRLSEAECQNTVIVQAIPMADQTVTEDMLVAQFSVFGDITRLIIQTAPSAKTQRAVVVFASAESATAALAFNGRSLLDQPVTVVLPTAADIRAGGNGGAGVPEGGNYPSLAHVSEKSSMIVAGFLAEGILAGHKGLAYAKRYDEQHQISHRIREQDQQRGISQTAERWVQQANAQAKVVAERADSSWKEFDEKHKVGERVKATTEQVVANVEAGAARAMENEHVARGVAEARKAMSSLFAWGNQTIDRVNDTVERRRSESAQRAEEASVASETT